MSALLWKDYRLNRGVLLLGVALLLAPYGTFLAVTLHAHWPSLPGAAEWSELLLTASLFSLGLSQLALVTLAGNSIASERADRSAEFLAYLPPSRLRILASKLLLALLAAAVIWTVNLLVAWLVVPALGTSQGNPTDALSLQFMLAATAVMLLGTGWFGSALLDSPAIATCLGIGATLALPVSIVTTLCMFVSPPDDLKHWYCMTCLILGVLCFVCGSVYYLRRVEP
jgi:ABC-type transport system involved in multi-copper enzyme maturation permease subunit